MYGFVKPKCILTVKMKEENKMHFRHLMLFNFRKGKNAIETTKKICAVYGDGVVTYNSVCKWFAWFRSENFDLENQKRSGGPLVADQIVTLIANNPCHTTQDIAEMLHVPHMSNARHLKSHGYVNQYDMWIPRNLSENSLIDRISMSDSLLKRNKYDPFLK